MKRLAFLYRVFVPPVAILVCAVCSNCGDNDEERLPSTEWFHSNGDASNNQTEKNDQAHGDTTKETLSRVQKSSDVVKPCPQ